MNRIAHAAFCVPFGMIKMVFIKALHFNSFTAPTLSMVSPHTEITIDKGAKLHIGNRFKMRDGAKIRVRNGAACTIGDNVLINSNNILACREKIEIGNGCELGPNVQIYDHDHDFRTEGGIKAGKYKTSPVKIGDNVWVGANTVVLRGTEIGDNCVIAAGSVLKGTFPANSVVVQ